MKMNTMPNRLSLSVEFEFYAKVVKPKQTGYFSIAHTFENPKIKYTSTQLALGYRYRFINQAVFNIYGDLKFATYTISKETFILPDNTTAIVNEQFFSCSFKFWSGIGY